MRSVRAFQTAAAVVLAGALLSPPAVASHQVESIRPWKGKGTWPMSARLFDDQPSTCGSVPEKEHSWYVRVTADAYEQYGVQDPAWDSAAHEALDLCGQYWGGTNGISRGARFDACVKAIEAGCEDPAVLYFYTVSRMQCEEPGEAEERGLLAKAAEDFAASRYPAALKAWCFLTAAGQQPAPHGGRTENQTRNMTILLDAAFSLIPPAITDPTMPTRDIMDLCDDYIRRYQRRYGDAEPAFEDLLNVLRQTMPEDSPIPDTLAGDHLLGQAWKARGGGYGYTVTEHAWELFRERHQAAEEAYLRAWALDNKNPRLAYRMMRIAAESSGHEEMEKWFQRAMILDPNYYAACGRKLFFLTPKWGGSEEELLAFGRECYDTGNWEGRLPFILVDAHAQLAGSPAYPEKHAYYLRPGVWDDIEKVFAPYLERYPDSARERTQYAWYASVTHRWKLAHEQFEILGDRAHVRSFGNRERLDAVREEARLRAAGETEPANPILPNDVIRALTDGDLSAVTAWLESGPPIDSVNEMGESALGIAAAANQLGVAALLVEHGADVSFKNLSKQSILDRIMNAQRAEMAIFLIESGADVMERNKKGENIAMRRAINSRLVTVVEHLLDHGVKPDTRDKKKNTLLHKAASQGYPEIIDLLVARGADLEAKNSYQYTPLINACSARKLEAATALLNNGAEVDGKTTLNTTALVNAVYKGYTEIIRLLLDRGAEIDIVYKQTGQTPLMIAAENGHTESVELLLERGANRAAMDKYGKTALDTGRERNHPAIVALLQQTP